MEDVKIIYQDDNLLVVDKQPGLIVTRSETTKEETLEDRLSVHNKQAVDRMGIVHRLDKDTSGLILIAKTSPALLNLQAQFKQRKIKKEYLALVHGLVEKGGVVDEAIIRNPANRQKFTVISTSKESSSATFKVSSAREAVTQYEPIKQLTINNGQWTKIFVDLTKIQMRKLQRINYNQFTLLKCHPLTGRTHQIRVHLKYIGHPVVCDEKYAGRKMVRLDKRWCPRMFLHAKKLGFYHPGSGKWMEVESELAEDLEKALSNLKCQNYNSNLKSSKSFKI